MSHDTPEAIKKEVLGYLIVFGVLFILTVVTVSVSYLHLPIQQAVILALIIACIKAGLVVCYFMHLISERKLIYAILILVVVFFIALMALPSCQHHDIIRGATIVP